MSHYKILFDYFKEIIMVRNQTKRIYVGDVPIGNGAPISVQSMTNTNTSDIKATVNQINKFEAAGCDISRSAVNNLEDCEAIKEIKKRTNIPFIADIQYSWRIAIEAVKMGADCLRINPGNIGGKYKIKEIISVLKDYNIPLRIGVNSGSIHEKYLSKYGGVNVDSLVNSCVDEIELIESLGFTNMKLSIKSSSINLSIQAHEKISKLCDYPLHVGITEAGPGQSGIIKSSVGIGSILSRGIGDTIRCSLTQNPVEEVKLGVEILKSLGLRQHGVNIVSCPTCSRTKIDLVSIANEAQEYLKNMNKNITVAIMGCPVNGPGEAREADIGIAGGNGQGIIFKKGKIVKKVQEEVLLEELLKEIDEL